MSLETCFNMANNKTRDKIKMEVLNGGPLYKKTRDEMKLDFYNSCVDRARKYKIVELTQKERDFKRKYSWCMKGRPNSSPSRKSSLTTSESDKQQLQRSTQRGPLPTISRNVKLNFSEPDKSITEPGQVNGSSSVEVKPKSFSTPTGSSPVGVPEFMSNPPSTVGRRTSLAGGELPSLVASRRKSLMDVESTERVSYLEDLWNKVFSMGEDQDKQRGRCSRRQEQASRENFTGIVMQQFEPGGKTLLSNVNKQDQHTSLQQKSRRIRDRRSSDRSDLSKEDSDVETAGSNVQTDNIMDEDTIVDEQKSERKTVLRDVSPPSSPPITEMRRGGDYSEDCPDGEVTNEDKTQNWVHSDDTVPKDPIKVKPQRLQRIKSAQFSLIKPPFHNYWRPRSMSLEGDIHGNLWKAANLSLLASRRTGTDRFLKCVRLALTKERIANLQGKKWRDDLKRCRYLRIPKKSLYLTPINSDDDSDGEY